MKTKTLIKMRVKHPLRSKSMILTIERFPDMLCLTTRDGKIKLCTGQECQTVIEALRWAEQGIEQANERSCYTDSQTLEISRGILRVGYFPRAHANAYDNVFIQKTLSIQIMVSHGIKSQELIQAMENLLQDGLSD